MINLSCSGIKKPAHNYSQPLISQKAVSFTGVNEEQVVEAADKMGKKAGSFIRTQFQAAKPKVAKFASEQYQAARPKVAKFASDTAPKVDKAIDSGIDIVGNVIGRAAAGARRLIVRSFESYRKYK